MSKPERELAKAPPLRFLRGDEMVLNCNGSISRAISVIDDNQEHAPHLRAAIAIWQSDASSRPSIEPNAKALLSRRLDNMQHCSAGLRESNKQHNVMWNILRPQEPRLFGSHKEGNNTIDRLPVATPPQGHRLTTPAYLDSLVPGEQWQASKELLEAAPVFTKEFKDLFAYANIPIMIIGGSPRNNYSRPLSTYKVAASFLQDVSISHGIVCHNETLKLLGAEQGSDDRHRGLRLASRMIVMAGLKVMAPQWNQLTPKHPDWLDISREFEAKGKKFMLQATIDADQQDENKYSLPDILSFMHFFKHSGIYSEQEVRETLPLCSAMYDRFNVELKKAVKEYKLNPLYDPIVVTNARQEAQHSAPEDPATGVPDSADPAPAELTIAEMASAGIVGVGDPHLVARINILKQDIDAFLKNALDANPPCNQFHCRLTLCDKAQAARFPIHFTLRNAKGEKRDFTLPTSAENLDQAITIKKILQSYILNQNTVEPVSLRKYSSGSYCNGDSYIPKQTPSNISLIDHGKYYAASFEFGTNDPVRVIVPLGLPYSPYNQAIAADANSRMDHLVKHVASLQSSDQWETVAEITHYLKSAVRQVPELNSSNQGWKVAPIISLKDALADLPYASSDEDGGVLLSHSTDAAQSIGFKNASLRFDTQCHNPTWRLHYNVSFNEGDGKTRLFPCSLNLHTADETVAEDRATQALADFSETLYLLKEVYPNFTWKSSGEATADVKLVDAQGNSPKSPEPQNLQHLIDDMPQPKTAFRIVTTQEKISGGDKILTLKVVRGSKQQNDMEYINGRDGKQLKRRVTIDSRKSSSTDAVIADIERSFLAGLDSAYSSRVVSEAGLAVRKTPQEFRLATVCNLFDRAIEAHVTDIAGLDQAARLKRRDIVQTFAEKVGKLDIAPGSDDLKRTGRVSFMH